MPLTTPAKPLKSQRAPEDLDDIPRLLTVREAAGRLALSRSTLYNLMERGDLAYAKIGRARRIPFAEIERLVRDSMIPRRA